jgi:hypothetical protein
MRTEDDLRAALTALERHAPARDKVLSAPARHRRRPFITTAAITAVAAAVAVVMIVIPGRSPARAPVAGHAPLDLQAKLLAALNSTGDDIVFSRTIKPYEGKQVQEDWCGNCLDPRNGTVVRDRTLLLNPNGTRNSEWVMSYTQNPSLGVIPHAMKNNKDATWAKVLDVRYYSRTWDTQTWAILSDMNPASGTDIRQGVGAGGWKQVGTSTIDGQAALKLEAVHSAPSVSYLWVNAQTYVPIRWVVFNNGALWMQVDYRMLPDTPANQAQLVVTIPPGFRHMG